MNAILSQVKREFVEHKGAILYGPMVIAALMIAVLVFAITVFEIKSDGAELVWSESKNDLELVIRNDEDPVSINTRVEPFAPKAHKPVKPQMSTTITEETLVHNDIKVRRIEIVKPNGSRNVLVIPEDKAHLVDGNKLDGFKVIVKERSQSEASSEFEVSSEFEAQIEQQVERELERAEAQIARAEAEAARHVAEIEAHEHEIESHKQEMKRVISIESKKTPRTEMTEKDLRVIENALLLMVAIFMVYAFFVSVVYALNTLHADRKDRSILFWKSLPVSETTNVLVKLGFALLAVPAGALLSAFVVQAAYLLAAGYYIQSITDIGFWQVMSASNYFGNMATVIGYVLISAPWAAGFYAWILLASAFAKRNPFLITVLPVLVLAGIENYLFNTKLVGNFVLSHVPVWSFNGDVQDEVAMTIQHSFSDFFSIDFVTGLIMTAAFIYGAIWLRKNRFEI